MVKNVAGGSRPRGSRSSQHHVGPTHTDLAAACALIRSQCELETGRSPVQCGSVRAGTERFKGLASLTDDGFVILVDRWKDMYISGGENVYPAEVENVLHAHPEVSQAAVVGAPHPRWGESGVAFVVVARNATVTPDELVAWCKTRLAGYKVPSQVMLVDELPRNATGKVLKGPLRQAVRGAEPTAP
jgi:acyl-CoA synthetase (AMP-forming)/AMP-acid ligase II